MLLYIQEAFWFIVKSDKSIKFTTPELVFEGHVISSIVFSWKTFLSINAAKEKFTVWWLSLGPLVDADAL